MDPRKLLNSLKIERKQQIQQILPMQDLLRLDMSSLNNIKLFNLQTNFSSSIFSIFIFPFYSLKNTPRYSENFNSINLKDSSVYTN